MDNRKSNLARIIEIPKFVDDYGKIYIADRELPFEVRRVLWIYDLKSGRGKKAQRECEQIYIALKGQVRVKVFDGSWHEFVLKSPDEGLYLPSMTWRSIHRETLNPILLVLASEAYDPDDKISDFEEFSRMLFENEMEKGLKFADEVS